MISYRKEKIVQQSYAIQYCTVVCGIETTVNITDKIHWANDLASTYKLLNI